jgi:hypothetical protein
VLEREACFFFSDNVLDSGPMVEVDDLAEATSAETDKANSLTD